MSLVTGLKKDYGNFLLDIPRWEIADNGITVLWGPSGSGKSSCFRLLIGLEDCPGLKWEFRGEDLAQMPVPKRRLGVVFQSYDLFPHLSAEQNIAFAAKARKIDSAQAKITSICDQLSLGDCWNTPARLLSGGEQQRVALARALIGEPRFLFLDEPFAALDTDLRQEARTLVRNLVTKYSIPTLLVTHDAEDVKALADQMTKISRGRLLFE